MELDAWLQVTVRNGMFSSERAVRFLGHERAVSLIVDRGHVDGDRLRVNVLWFAFDKALVSLPREPFNGSRRVIVAAAELAFSGETVEANDDSM